MSTPLSNDARVMAQALLLERKRKPEEALRILESHEFGSRLEALATVQRAHILEELDVERCFQTYQSAIERYPNDAVVLLRAGVFVFKRGDVQKAKGLLIKSWNACATPEAGYYLGSINKAEGRNDEALEFFIQTAVMEGDEGYWKQRAVKEIS